MLLPQTLDECRRQAPRRGVVLLAVLMVVAVLTLAAYEYSSRMLEEYRAADAYRKSIQARALANSGVHYVAGVLADPDGLSQTFGNQLTNNPTAFQVQPNDAASYNGRFTLIAPMDPDDPNYADPYWAPGIIDESSKINVNALIALDSSGTVLNNVLINLPNITQDNVSAIQNWVAPASADLPTMSSDAQYYQGLQPPYNIKNAPLDTLQEMLLIRGITPDVLYGQDYNRSGVPGPGQPNSQTGTPLQLGLSAYLTLYSREPNVDVNGNPRINMNRSLSTQDDVTQLVTDIQTALSNAGCSDAANVANFIAAARVHGIGTGGTTMTTVTITSNGTTTTTTTKSDNDADDKGGSTPVPQSALQLSGRAQSIPSVYQLIGGSVTVPGTTPQQPSVTYKSPITQDMNSLTTYASVFDELTTSNVAEMPARVNVRTAPRSVLMALPVFNGGNTTEGAQQTDSTQADYIINQRETAQTSTDLLYQTPVWLLADSSSPFKPTDLQTLDKYITSRSYVYRVQSIGDFTTGGPSARVEAVIDLTYFDQTTGVAPGTRRPRIVYYRDLTELGKGVTLPTQNQNGR